MWTLILTTSLVSQFNHALDIRVVTNLSTEHHCNSVGNTAAADLKHFNKEISVKISCIKEQ